MTGYAKAFTGKPMKAGYVIECYQCGKSNGPLSPTPINEGEK